MLTTLAFLLASYGLTLIVTESRLFAPLREAVLCRSKPLGRWLRCAMCFGFAAGVFWRLVGLDIGSGLPLPLDLLAAGCASSGVAWAMRVALHALGSDDL